MTTARGAAFVIQPMTQAAAHAIVGWRYSPPYDLYHSSDDTPEQVRHLCDLANDYHAVYEKPAAGRQPTLIGFCCYGADARVPGGDYREEALDIGVGLRPDLTGQGRGHAFIGAVIDDARQRYAPTTLRATIAQFNLRSQRTFLRHGFQPEQYFESTAVPLRRFVVMTANASPSLVQQDR